MDIFFFWGGGGDHKIGLYLGVISMHSGVFKVQNGGYIWGLVKFQIFIFEVLEIPDIVFG